MNVVKDAIHHLHPGQTPVLTVDQPLFALGKHIQWNLTETHGEDQIVLVMGGLHIEMAFLNILGVWLEDSGWVSALVQSNVLTTGRADNILKAVNVTRARYANQVTAASLHALQKVLGYHSTAST